jgi:hypothetical protein
VENVFCVARNQVEELFLIELTKIKIKNKNAKQRFYFIYAIKKIPTEN